METSWFYADGAIKKVETADGRTKEFDAAGNLVKEITAEGFVYTYDAATGRVTSVTEPSGVYYEYLLGIPGYESKMAIANEIIRLVVDRVESKS